MIVIIEGADLAGKSTNAERLSADECWPIVKIRWDLIGDPMVETTAMAKATTTMLAALDPDAVFDRSFLSWWAYGPVLGHEVSYMPALADRLSGLREVNVVLLTASATELRRRYERAPDAWFTIDQIVTANERIPSIETLLPRGVRCIHIDTTARSLDDVYADVRTFLHLQQ